MTEITQPSASRPHREELRHYWHTFLRTWHQNRRPVLKVFDDTVVEATSPLVGLPMVAQEHSELSDDDRPLFIQRAVEYLLTTAVNAANADFAAKQLLDDLGGTFMELLLSGAAEQVFTADLARALGAVREMPDVLRDSVCAPLVKALATSLSLGAPGTRHVLMEGLGALLRHLPHDRTLQSLPSIDKTARDREGDPSINEKYEGRRQRHELIVLAISGDATKREEYFAKIDGTPQSYDHRADHLRALPAIYRQEPAETKEGMLADIVTRLCTAVSAPGIGIEASPEAQAAFARYQEIVFQTIDVMLSEGADPEQFNVVVADAVGAIRPTLVGSLDVCNAQVRATIAVIYTATRIAARLSDSKTDDALRPWYLALGKKWQEWMNPGIMEGCFRGLPLLLPDREHDAWTIKALEALLEQLSSPVEQSDLGATYARLCATASFRDLLIAVTQRLHRRLRSSEADPEKHTKEIEQTIHSLLAQPSAQAILDIFKKNGSTPSLKNYTAPTFSAGVLGAVAFATELLDHSEPMFRPWDDMTPARQMLLVRILSLELRSASEGRIALARCRELSRVLSGLEPVRVAEKDRTKKLWHLISKIPAAAGEAVDSDLQQFVSYRGMHVTEEEQSSFCDLPQYVLAMVSDYSSYRLAADVARQVDLRRHRARLQPSEFDFAEPLYQIMLRGPHQSIFNHLLARIAEPRDRELLTLLRTHVITVQACVKAITKSGNETPIALLTTHAKTLIGQMDTYLMDHESATLDGLVIAMKRFVALGTQTPELWNVIIGKPQEPALVELFDTDNTNEGGLDSLFNILDTLAAASPVRKNLTNLCAKDCLELRSKVEHFLSVSVGDFAECAEALKDAIEATDLIRTKLEKGAGLQPPERTILVALIDSWLEMFRHTLEWWVDAPRRCVQAHRPKTFWLTFVRAVDSKGLTIKPEPELALPKVPQPPIPSAQNLAFERYYVDWMASELDIDHLRWALQKRWKGLFGFAYRQITNKFRVFLLILFPFLLAGIAAPLGYGEYEGIGFLLYVTAVGLFTVIGLAGDRVRKLYKWARPRVRAFFKKPVVSDSTAPFEYRFHALLPRLLKLIVVPLALLVDFDHSYLFPVHARADVLVILMALALLTTFYFVRREVKARQNERSRMNDVSIEEGKKERRRVGQIVAIALAHSFSAAILLSFLFESGIIRRSTAVDETLAAISMQQTPPAVERAEALRHEAHYFLWILPREAKCDLRALAHQIGMSSRFAEKMRFYFYPTLILSWTALGLFFGVFLEGFMKGERLRGET